MSDYINTIKRKLRDEYNFKQVSGTKEDPVLETVPDGNYPMIIDNKRDIVMIKDGKINCCNFESEEQPI